LCFFGCQGDCYYFGEERLRACEIFSTTETALSSEDIKDPSAEASLVGGKFFTDIWDNSGREMAQEIIQKSKKGIHDARKVAEAAEKSAEPERQIDIN
jgi:hypothetical protein